MIELTKNQKIIILVILGIVALVIGYYMFGTMQNQEEEIKNQNINLDIQNVQEQAVDKNSEIIIHVAGAVYNSGIKKLSENSRIADAIEAAGGLTSDANINNINLAQKIADGQKIYIPSINDDEITEQIIIQDTQENNSLFNSAIININTATQTELETLPGIGPSMASKIIEYRKENGSFKDIEDLKNVSGIGESKYAQVKNKITI